MKQLISDTIVNVAQGQIGVRESDDNSGKQVQEYQAATTLNGTHWPWCAAFVAWCLIQAGATLGIVIAWLNSASCDVILTDARNRGLLVTKPQPGDVFLVRARLKNGTLAKNDMIHTGIVETVNLAKGTFTEIAGNTNNDGGSEGIGVMRTTRDIAGRYYFVRVVDGIAQSELDKLATAETPAPVARPWTASVQLPQGGAGGVIRGLPCRLDGSVVYVAIRDWGRVTEQKVDFDPGHQAALLAGREVPLQARLWDGQMFFPIRDLCEMAGGFMLVNAAARTAKAVFS